VDVANPPDNIRCLSDRANVSLNRSIGDGNAVNCVLHKVGSVVEHVPSTYSLEE